jgi:hypothetical protein
MGFEHDGKISGFYPGDAVHFATYLEPIRKPHLGFAQRHEPDTAASRALPAIRSLAFGP